MMKSKWVAALLLFSLGLNLALVGFMVGRSSHPGVAGDPTRGFLRWMHGLPADRREELHPMVANHMRAVRPEMRSLRQRHRALQEAIVAEPFEPEALNAALNDMRTQNINLQQASHAAFMAFVSHLSVTEREALSNDMQTQGHRRPERR